MIRPLLAGFQFLTRIPVGGQFSVKEVERSVSLFPLIGLTLGGLTALLWLGLSALGLSAAFRAFAAITVLAWLTGGLHLDGLADTADGMLSSQPRERILEIMKDSRIGSMGVLALMVILGLKVLGLAEAASLGWKCLLLAPAAGKLAQVGSMAFIPYIRPHGLAELFVKGCRQRHFLAGTVFLTVLWGTLTGWTGLVPLVLSALPGIWFSRRCLIRLGGITGDTLGAVCEITEASVFCAFAICGPLF